MWRFRPPGFYILNWVKIKLIVSSKSLQRWTRQPLLLLLELASSSSSIPPIVTVQGSIIDSRTFLLQLKCTHREAVNPHTHTSSPQPRWRRSLAPELWSDIPVKLIGMSCSVDCATWISFFCVSFFLFFFVSSIWGGGRRGGRERGQVQLKKKKKDPDDTNYEFQYKDKTLKKKRNKDVKGMVCVLSFDIYDFWRLFGLRFSAISTRLINF